MFSRRPLPSTQGLRQMRAFRSMSPITISSTSRLGARGRSWRNPNSLGSPGGVERLTANSISTGELVPAAPMSMSSAVISARGKTSCFRIGAKLTRRIPSREMPS